jgi:hypothetical protein
LLPAEATACGHGQRQADLHGAFPITKLHNRSDSVCDEARSSESRTINLLAPGCITMSRPVLQWTDQHIRSGSYSLAISSGICLTPRLLSPTPPDAEDSLELPQLLSPTLPSAVEDYLAIRTLPHMASGQFVSSTMNRPVLWTDWHIHAANPPLAIDTRNSSAMDRWIEDVRFHGSQRGYANTIVCSSSPHPVETNTSAR